ncbi:polysaccharide deacetylase [Bradyrhizobium sp. WD16]|nr:polysaccharide deacetylase [Bradyrhizobium sp. WD16]
MANEEVLPSRASGHTHPEAANHRRSAQSALQDPNAATLGASPHRSVNLAEPLKQLPIVKATLPVLAALLALLVPHGAAANCQRPGALGTSRVLSVDPRTYPRVGTKSFPASLPLADKEVVLTFDDGPSPPTTRKVLAALARECVRATFFLIGRNAAAHPGVVKAIAAAGHTIGHHSWSHPDMSKIPADVAERDIDRGMAANDAVLGLSAAAAPATPFFRFPYFSSTPRLLDALQDRGIAVFGADLWASDWNDMTPEQELNLVMERLQNARKGIILFHDTKGRTAAMMPSFLRWLRENDYRIVHIAPARPGHA